MMNRIKNVLNNECGGPNVEQIIGIGIAILVGVALYTLADTMFEWLGNAQTEVEDIPIGTITSNSGATMSSGS